MDFPGIRFIWAPHGNPLSLASLWCRSFSKRNTSSAFVECGTSTNEKFPKWVQTILKILYKWSSDQTKLNYNTGKFVEGRRKNFQSSVWGRKNFKVFRGRKIPKCPRPKNFKVFWGRKNFKVAWGQLIFQSPGGQVTSRPAKNFQSAESGQSVHVKWKSDSLSASWDPG